MTTIQDAATLPSYLSVGVQGLTLHAEPSGDAVIIRGHAAHYPVLGLHISRREAQTLARELGAAAAELGDTTSPEFDPAEAVTP